MLTDAEQRSLTEVENLITQMGSHALENLIALEQPPTPSVGISSRVQPIERSSCGYRATAAADANRAATATPTTQLAEQRNGENPAAAQLPAARKDQDEAADPAH